MPCWQSRTTTLEFTAADLDVLADALAAEGHTVTRKTDESISFNTKDGYSATFNKGEGITVSPNAALARDPNALKRGYTRAAIMKQAKRVGWRPQTLADARIVATRRKP